MAVIIVKKPVWRYLPVSGSDDPAGRLCKGVYLLLQLLDLGLTLVAKGTGATELNPVISGMLDSPVKLLVVKLFIPLLILRLVPGKLLIPGILFLALVIAWDAQELLSLVF